MSIKETFTSLVKGIKHKKEYQKEAELEHDTAKKIQMKEMSANEVELNKYLEKDRQKEIKKMLDNKRKEHTKEFLYGQNLRKEKNIFVNNKNIFHCKKIT